MQGDQCLTGESRSLRLLLPSGGWRLAPARQDMAGDGCLTHGRVMQQLLPQAVMPCSATEQCQGNVFQLGRCWLVTSSGEQGQLSLLSLPC